MLQGGGRGSSKKQAQGLFLLDYLKIRGYLIENLKKIINRFFVAF